MTTGTRCCCIRRRTEEKEKIGYSLEALRYYAVFHKKRDNTNQHKPNTNRLLNFGSLERLD